MRIAVSVEKQICALKHWRKEQSRLKCVGRAEEKKVRSEMSLEEEEK